MMLLERRFRPNFRSAFDAWLATDPQNNPNAPPGPMFRPEYSEPGLDKARQLDAQAAADYQEGAVAGSTSDDYVQTTVFLASVLFLVGISRHCNVRSARFGLVGMSACVVVFAVVRLLDSPRPPG